MSRVKELYREARDIQYLINGYWLVGQYLFIAANDADIEAMDVILNRVKE